VFQAEVELLQSVEVRLKEEMAALRETCARVDSEKLETTAKLDEALVSCFGTCSSEPARCCVSGLARISECFPVVEWMEWVKVCI